MSALPHDALFAFSRHRVNQQPPTSEHCGKQLELLYAPNTVAVSPRDTCERGQFRMFGRAPRTSSLCLFETPSLSLRPRLFDISH